MSKSKGKSSKSAPERATQPTYPIVTSDVCAKCTHQCRAGLRYLEHVSSGKFGKGVACKFNG